MSAANQDIRNKSNIINPDINLAAVLARMAPQRSRPGLIEHWKLESLPSRLGVDFETVEALLACGALRPAGEAHKSMDHGHMIPFEGAHLDKVSLGIAVAGLEVLADKNPGIDDHDLAVIAGNSLSMAARKTSRVIEFSKAEKDRLSAALKKGNTIRFGAGNNGIILLQAGAKRLGIKFDVPLTGRLGADKYKKKIQDDDLDRRDANVARAGVTGALAGALIKVGPLGRLRMVTRAAAGAAAGGAGVLAVRQTTNGGRDQYGERSRSGKKAETIPAYVGGGAAAVAAGLAVKKALAVRGIKFSRDLAKANAMTREEKTIVFDTLVEFGGADMRAEFGESAFARPDTIHFALGSIRDAIHAAAQFTKLKGIPAVKGAMLPGTTSRTAIDAAGKAAAIGGAAGAAQAGLDDEEDTSVAGGLARGAAAGAGLGAVAGVVGGMSPAARKAAVDYFRRKAAMA